MAFKFIPDCIFVKRFKIPYTLNKIEKDFKTYYKNYNIREVFYLNKKNLIIIEKHTSSCFVLFKYNDILLYIPFLDDIFRELKNKKTKILFLSKVEIRKYNDTFKINFEYNKIKLEVTEVKQIILK